MVIGLRMISPWRSTKINELIMRLYTYCIGLRRALTSPDFCMQAILWV